jgi:hypothetical protein
MTTPMGMAFAQMLAVFAELERKMIGQRISAALKVKMDAGWQPRRCEPRISGATCQRIVEMHQAGYRRGESQRHLIPARRRGAATAQHADDTRRKRDAGWPIPRGSACARASGRTAFPAREAGCHSRERRASDRAQSWSRRNRRGAETRPSRARQVPGSRMPRRETMRPRLCFFARGVSAVPESGRMVGTR